MSTTPTSGSIANLYRGMPLALTACLILGSVGCASPGPPRAPSLKLPRPVTDLAAQRIDHQVILRWTTPTKTTDGILIPDTPGKAAITARICRSTVAADPSAATDPSAAAQNTAIAQTGAAARTSPAAQPAKPGAVVAPQLAPPLPSTPAPPCNLVGRVPVHPGASTATDLLPATLTADPLRLLEYRIELENAVGRTAGPSNPAYSAAGSAPPAVDALRATSMVDGAMIEWAPATTLGLSHPITFLDLDRINPDLAAAKVTAKAPTKTSITKPTTTKTPATKTPAKPKPLQLAGDEPAEVHLRAAGLATGTIDTNARFGQTYTYTAQRVRPVQLSGHPLELRSSISPAITLALRDTFPPAVPSGLATIPATVPQPAIDLSWQPDIEPDLAGYLVYRRTLSAAALPAIRLTPNPIPGSAYRDLTAEPGQRYAYSVTAVDTSNNESKASAEVEEALR